MNIIFPSPIVAGPLFAMRAIAEPCDVDHHVDSFIFVYLICVSNFAIIQLRLQLRNAMINSYRLRAPVGRRKENDKSRIAARLGKSVPLTLRRAKDSQRAKNLNIINNIDCVDNATTCAKIFSQCSRWQWSTVSAILHTNFTCLETQCAAFRLIDRCDCNYSKNAMKIEAQLTDSSLSRMRIAPICSTETCSGYIIALIAVPFWAIEVTRPCARAEPFFAERKTPGENSAGKIGKSLAHFHKIAAHHSDSVPKFPSTILRKRCLFSFYLSSRWLVVHSIRFWAEQNFNGGRACQWRSTRRYITNYANEFPRNREKYNYFALIELPELHSGSAFIHFWFLTRWQRGISNKKNRFDGLPSTWRQAINLDGAFENDSNLSTNKTNGKPMQFECN